ncbi:hypothetical protein HG536_0B01340 [Torulaspora globosa]|uniref:Pre-mRNA-splicing factor CWC25 n=1 Tax=Torulaspora globosa TaxID=48254 RepID=A0A7G3ZCN6_9SACH|nr:uncharacterized protein HG536_0B01340 [Torulaspora globosa]QLL31272.1 hypothetical protein HG536_0B01340 [Torulaspora globosa]
MAGSSDLNLLKSWNPKLAKNRQKVQKKEQEALEEEKKIRQAAKERELNDLATAKSKTGLEWMYDVPKQPETKSLPQEKPKLQRKNSTEKRIPTANKAKASRYDKDDPMNKFKVAKKRLNKK